MGTDDLVKLVTACVLLVLAILKLIQEIRSNRRK